MKYCDELGATSSLGMASLRASLASSLADCAAAGEGEGREPSSEPADKTRTGADDVAAEEAGAVAVAVAGWETAVDPGANMSVACRST